MKRTPTLLILTAWLCVMAVGFAQIVHVERQVQHGAEGPPAGTIKLESQTVVRSEELIIEDPMMPNEGKRWRCPYGYVSSLTFQFVYTDGRGSSPPSSCQKEERGRDK